MPLEGSYLNPKESLSQMANGNNYKIRVIFGFNLMESRVDSMEYHRSPALVSIKSNSRRMMV